MVSPAVLVLGEMVLAEMALGGTVVMAPVAMVRAGTTVVVRVMDLETAMALVETVRAAMVQVVGKVRAVAARVREAVDKEHGVAAVVLAVAEEVAVDAKFTARYSRTLSGCSQRFAGVTLLETILALGLTTVVMGLIALAISLNFRMYDTKRTSIEEARLARSVLRHMADDIRAAVQHVPPDLSGLETVLGNTQNASAALSGAGLGALTGAAGQNGNQGGNQNGQGGQGNQGGQNTQPAGGQNGSGGGNQNGTGGGNQNGTGGAGLPTTMGNGTSGAVQPQTGEAGSIYGEEQAAGIIGLYGSSTELQIDISRLPRVDQFQAEVDPTNLNGVVDIPSDMKTVTYFLRPAPGMTDVGIDGRGRGLMRRVLDRAVSNWEAQSGGSTGSLGNLELMAEEVVGLQFMYFDGASWSSEWDSAAMQGLPVAIEITVVLQSLAEQDAQDATGLFSTAAEGEENERFYTLTVNLPTATSFDEKQQMAEEETALSQTGGIDTSGDAAAAGGLGGLGAGGLPGGGLGGMGGQSGPGGQGQGGPGQGGFGGGFGGGEGGFGGGQGSGGSGPRGGNGGSGQGGGGQGSGGSGPRGGGGGGRGGGRGR